MQWQTKDSARDHGKVTQRELPNVGREEAPLAQTERIAGFSQVPQHGGDDHYSKTNPEEREEAVEIVPC